MSNIEESKRILREQSKERKERLDDYKETIQKGVLDKIRKEPKPDIPSPNTPRVAPKDFTIKAVPLDPEDKVRPEPIEESDRPVPSPEGVYETDAPLIDLDNKPEDLDVILQEEDKEEPYEIQEEPEEDKDSVLQDIPKKDKDYQEQYLYDRMLPEHKQRFDKSIRDREEKEKERKKKRKNELLEALDKQKETLKTIEERKKELRRKPIEDTDTKNWLDKTKKFIRDVAFPWVRKEIKKTDTITVIKQMGMGAVELVAGAHDARFDVINWILDAVDGEDNWARPVANYLKTKQVGDLGHIAKGDSFVENAVRVITPYIAAYVAAGAAGFFKSASYVSRIAKVGALEGAVGFAVSKEGDKTLTDIVNSYKPTQKIVMGYFLTKKDDSAIDRRFKRALEDAMLGGAAEILLTPIYLAARALKKKRHARKALRQVKKARKDVIEPKVEEPKVDKDLRKEIEAEGIDPDMPINEMPKDMRQKVYTRQYREQAKMARQRGDKELADQFDKVADEIDKFFKDRAKAKKPKVEEPKAEGLSPEDIKERDEVFKGIRDSGFPPEELYSDSRRVAVLRTMRLEAEALSKAGKTKEADKLLDTAKRAEDYFKKHKAPETVLQETPPELKKEEPSPEIKQTKEEFPPEVKVVNFRKDLKDAQFLKQYLDPELYPVYRIIKDNPLWRKVYAWVLQEISENKNNEFLAEQLIDFLLREPEYAPILEDIYKTVDKISRQIGDGPATSGETLLLFLASRDFRPPKEAIREFVNTLNFKLSTRKGLEFEGVAISLDDYTATDAFKKFVKDRTLKEGKIKTARERASEALKIEEYDAELEKRFEKLEKERATRIEVGRQRAKDARPEAPIAKKEELNLGDEEIDNVLNQLDDVPDKDLADSKDIGVIDSDEPRPPERVIDKFFESDTKVPQRSDITKQYKKYLSDYRKSVQEVNPKRFDAKAEKKTFKDFEAELPKSEKKGKNFKKFKRLVQKYDLEDSDFFNLTDEQKIGIIQEFDQSPTLILMAMKYFKDGGGSINKEWLEYVAKMTTDLTVDENFVPKSIIQSEAGHVPSAFEQTQRRMVFAMKLIDLKEKIDKFRILKNSYDESVKGVDKEARAHVEKQYRQMTKSLIRDITELDLFYKGGISKGDSLVGQSLWSTNFLSEEVRIAGRALDGVSRLDGEHVSSRVFIDEVGKALDQAHNLPKSKREEAYKLLTEKVIPSAVKGSHDLEKPTAWARFFSLYVETSMLSDPITWVKVFGLTGSRVALALVRQSATDLSLFLQDIFKKGNRAPFTAYGQAKGIIKAFPESFRNAFNVLRGKPTELSKKAPTLRMRYQGLTRAMDEIGILDSHARKLIMSLPRYMIAAGDTWWTTYTYHYTLQRLARLRASESFSFGSDEYKEAVEQLIQNPTDEMMERIVRDMGVISYSRGGKETPSIIGGDFNLFGKERRLTVGRGLYEIRKAINKFPVVGPLFDTAMKFLNPEINFMDDIIRLTPGVAFLNPEVRYAWATKDRRIRREVMMQQLAGASAILSGMMKASEGHLMGSTPDLRDLNQDISGVWKDREDSLLTDDGNIIKIRRENVQGTLYLLGAELARAWSYVSKDKRSDFLVDAYRLIRDALGSVTDAVFNVGQFSERYEDLHNMVSFIADKDARKETSIDLGGLVIPYGNLVYRLSKTRHKHYKLNYVSGIEEGKPAAAERLGVLKKTIKQGLRKIYSKIPVFNDHLPPRLDVFGNIIHPHPGIGLDFSSPWASLFSFPFNIVGVNEDKALELILRNQERVREINKTLKGGDLSKEERTDLIKEREKLSKKTKKLGEKETWESVVRREIIKVTGVRGWYIYDHADPSTDIDWRGVMPRNTINLNQFRNQTAGAVFNRQSTPDQLARENISLEMRYSGDLKELGSVRMPDRMYNNLIVLSNGLKDVWFNPKTGHLYRGKKRASASYVSLIDYEGVRELITGDYGEMSKKEALYRMITGEGLRSIDNTQIWHEDYTHEDNTSEDKKFLLKGLFFVYNSNARKVFNHIYKKQIENIIDDTVKGIKRRVR